MKYTKYHALGNDYIVIHPRDIKKEFEPDVIQRICHRNYGVGSDGILFGPLESKSSDFRLKIYNPDGSEAEKSGNGLRIFARYLRDNGYASNNEFSVETAGGRVLCDVDEKSGRVRVEMGGVSFFSPDIPVTGEARQVINETMEIDGAGLKFCAVTVGNPHCVILTDDVTKQAALRFGPLIETNTMFPNRINVQLMKAIDQQNIQIEIWERGAGYTLASGSSSTAAAAVALKLGLCRKDILVHMPGGTIQLSFDDHFNAVMTGPVTRVCDGVMSTQMFDHNIPDAE